MRISDWSSDVCSSDLFAILFMLISLMLLLAAIWFGLLIANRLVTPIGEVVSVAERIRAGDLTARVTEQGDDDEIATLGRTFNRMTGQLAAQQSELIADRKSTRLNSSH